MRWALRKIDSLVGTVVAATTGLLASQLLAFIHAYQQRLGGHLDEARRAQTELLAQHVAPAVGNEPFRARMTELAQARVDALDSAYRAIDQAGAFTRPFAFFSHLDQQIAVSTARVFHPAIPFDMPSLAFGAAGMILGWMLWELVKAPFPPYRRSARAGG